MHRAKARVTSRRRFWTPRRRARRACGGHRGCGCRMPVAVRRRTLLGVRQVWSRAWRSVRVATAAAAHAEARSRLRDRLFCAQGAQSAILSPFAASVVALSQTITSPPLKSANKATGKHRTNSAKAPRRRTAAKALLGAVRDDDQCAADGPVCGDDEDTIAARRLSCTLLELDARCVGANAARENAAHARARRRARPRASPNARALRPCATLRALRPPATLRGRRHRWLQLRRRSRHFKTYLSWSCR